MVFSISNLTIIYMTVVVIFFNGYSDGSIEICRKELKTLQFNKKISPFDNLKTMLNVILNMVDNPKEKFKTKNDLDEYVLRAKQKIELFFSAKKIINNSNLKYAPRYILHLQEHIIDPEKMLSVVTWCDLDVVTKDDISEFVRVESDTKFKNEDEYHKYYIKRVANNTGLPRKDRLAAFKTFTVCLKETKYANSLPRKDRLAAFKTFTGYIYTTYGSEFIQNQNNIEELEPLSWCATRVCYDSLIKSGFKDKQVEQNIGLILSKKKLTEERNGRYAFQFYEYLRKVNKKDEEYPIVSPYESKIFIHYGYLRNWCSVQVCYDDLKAAGFIYWHASDNYFYVYPTFSGQSTPNVQHSEIKNYSPFSSKYVIAYRDHLKHVSKRFNHAEPRSPEDFCIYHIIKTNSLYYSYI